MSIWTEKYRPKSLDELILPDKIKNDFKFILSSTNLKSDLINLLLSGPPGTGKTSSAKLIPKLLDLPYLYINASEESGIDILRTKIKDFSTSQTIDDKIKVVILDESEGLCLDEDTELLIGSLKNQYSIKIKDIKKNTYYDIVSLNTETNELENDKCIVCTDRKDECFEVELETNEIIKCTLEHPFFIEREGKIIEIPLKDLKEGDSIIKIVLE